MPAGRPRIDKYADADMLLLTRADEVFRTAAPPITPTAAIRRVVRAVHRANKFFREAKPTATWHEVLTTLGEDARWCYDLEGKPLDIGGPANFDSIIRRLVGRFKRTRFTKSGMRLARFPPRVHFGNLAIARAVDKRKHSRKHRPHKGRTNKAS